MAGENGTDSTNVENEKLENNETVVQEENSNNTEEKTNMNGDSSESNKDTDKTDESNSSNEESEIKYFNNASESSGGLYDTTALTKEVTKYETLLENSNKSKPDVNEFYKNPESYLSEEEKQLFFEDDKSKYFEAIEKAKNEFLNNQKVDTTENEELLKVSKGRLVIATAIDSVLQDPEYKDFNFVRLQEFYNDDLTGKERRELDKDSDKENLTEYFKKIHNLYKERNPIKVKNVEAPNIPDASNLSKTSIEDKQEIDNKKQNEKYKSSIGFRKL